MVDLKLQGSRFCLVFRCESFREKKTIFEIPRHFSQKNHKIDDICRKFLVFLNLLHF